LGWFHDLFSVLDAVHFHDFLVPGFQPASQRETGFDSKMSIPWRFAGEEESQTILWDRQLRRTFRKRR
jgi:hypothetical protein